MRRSWRESRRLRSRRLFCTARKPEICWVVYHEYATTAARGTINPRKSPAVGDRTVERCTPRDYNGAAHGSKLALERRASPCVEACLDSDGVTRLPAPVGSRATNRQPTKSEHPRGSFHPQGQCLASGHAFTGCGKKNQIRETGKAPGLLVPQSG